jgi:hypothetical protein
MVWHNKLKEFCEIYSSLYAPSANAHFPKCYQQTRKLPFYYHQNGDSLKCHSAFGIRHNATQVWGFAEMPLTSILELQIILSFPSYVY